MAFVSRLASPRVAPSFSNYDKVQKLAEEGKLKEALHLVEVMVNQSSKAPKGAFIFLLKGCTRRKALAVGRQVHALIAQSKHDNNKLLSNLLVDMYSSCGSVVEAFNVFTAMPKRNVFSWTAMVSAYVNSGKHKEGLTLFQRMQEVGMDPNKVTCVVVLKACTGIGALKEGQDLHALIVKKGFESDVIIQTTLIDMYSKCGCLTDAREVFNKIPQRDVVCWNAIISAYARKGLGHESLDLYEKMKHEGMEPDKVTFVLLLKACASISALEQGRRFHSIIREKGLESDMTLQTSLVDMYAKCGCLDDARELFSNMTQSDVVSWSAMIAGYTQQGLGKEALDLYEQMKRDGVEPNKVTFVLLLKACASIAALDRGRELHSLILRKGLESETTIQNSLIDMYAKCGCLHDAHELFNNMPTRDVVSWNSMFAGYAHEGLAKEALDLYDQMKREGMQPDRITLILLLKTCASISAGEHGRCLHSIILEKDLESEMTIQNSLIDMYSKCGRLNDARELFNHMPKRETVSWNAMIAGYAQEGLGEEALDLYEQMNHEGMEPDVVTLVLLLKACAGVSALEQGRRLHSLILKKGLESDMTIQTSLIDMYSKCGCLKKAHELFNNISRRDVVLWSALIVGYAQKGLGEEALSLYEQMTHEGLEPDNITLVLLLKACAGIAALEQGRRFHSLILEKGLELETVVQNSLVDMYAKCGHVRNARDLFDNMHRQDVVSWNTMIAGYAQEGLGKEALDLYQQMTRTGLQANEATYTSVLSACSHSRLVNEGRHVFENMLKDRGVTPTLEHYGCMVDLLGRAGFLANAENLILKMPIQPDEVIWMSLLGAARKYANVDIGRRAFKHVVELKQEEVASPYLLLMDIYWAAGRMDEVVQLRKEMKHKGLEKGLEVQLDCDNRLHASMGNRLHVSMGS